MTNPGAWWEREEHRLFGREPTADDLLDRHLSRTGAREAVRTDPFASVTVNILRDFLRLLRAALDDEHIEPDIARRVVERVMLGGVPSPSDVAYRAEQQRAFTDYMSTDTRRMRIDLPTGPNWPLKPPEEQP